MSAIEELREKLDELGIEWDVMPHPDIADHSVTYKSNGIHWLVIENLSGNMLSITNYKEKLSVEQVIAATLGCGECKLPETRIDHGSIEYRGVTEWRRCSACGTEVLAYPVHFCPNCGRRVVSDG